MPALDLLAVSFDDVQQFALTWLPILFMGLIVVLIAMTLRYCRGRSRRRSSRSRRTRSSGTT
jgi:hypothetical protein